MPALLVIDMRRYGDGELVHDHPIVSTKNSQLVSKMNDQGGARATPPANSLAELILRPNDDVAEPADAIPAESESSP